MLAGQADEINLTLNKITPINTKVEIVLSALGKEGGETQGYINVNYKRRSLGECVFLGTGHKERVMNLIQDVLSFRV